jgi:L-alanine-DL-glutamate epimerase-like enolase superfamily enzyme
VSTRSPEEGATIRSVRARAWNIALTEPFGIATGAQYVAANVLVEVRLADGTVGLGEAAPFPAVNGETQADALAAVPHVETATAGMDARRYRHVGGAVRETTAHAPSARAAVECAVIDAITRRARMSLLHFFGGAESRLETDITIVTGDADHARTSAARAARDGFRTLKVKVGGVPHALDVERLDAIVHAAPEVRLLLDANASLEVDEAVELVRRVGKARVALFEQPTARDDFDALRAVRERADVLVAADESVRSASDVVALALARAVDVINVKITKGGLLEAWDVITAARAAGFGLMIGGMVETPLMMSVSACLAGGFGNFAFVDLDTPLFMKDTETHGGYLQEGPSLDLSPILEGHGVTVRPPRVS